MDRKVHDGMSDMDVATEFSYIENLIRLWVGDPTKAAEQIAISQDLREKYGD